ncbi:MAG: hypothetical protein ACNS61_11700 [Candidatus Wenzhouxiangella sp. M2_3B_020]
MIIADLVLAFALASLLTMLIAPSRRYDGNASWLLLFVLLFVLIWAGGTWLTPIGPPAAGVHWLSFLAVSLFLLLLVLALAPRWRTGRARGTKPGAAAGSAQFGVFFWLLLIVALGAVIAYYV